MMSKRSPFVLKRTGQGKWTVGYYKANYRWVAVGDWYDEETAANAVRELNK